MQDKLAEPMSGATLLISDDDQLLVSALARYFRSQGVQVIADLNSNVVELARAYQPTLIILDIAQSIDGRDLLAQLKRDLKTKHIDVFVVTANRDSFTRAVCFQLGARGYFLKPTDQSFIHKVNDYLTRSSGPLQ
jgi:two-component system, OmpR family, response regulator AdeR